MKPAVIGVDLGATRIKAGLVDGAGRILARATIATQASRGPGTVLANAAALVNQLRREGKPKALGVGSTGMIDPCLGRVIAATETMPGWAGTELAAQLRRRAGLPCRVDNDGNAAALGEAAFGAGRGQKVFAMLTLGTGVGGGIVIDGRVLHGAGFMAGKLGHLKVKPGGRLCPCGARGCLEAYASASACRRAFPGKDERTVFSLARRHGSLARVYELAT